MSDLTEQLKKGELPENFYYVDVPEGSPIAYGNGNYIEIETPEFGYLFYMKGEESKLPDYVKVLAPVPTYEKWMNAQKDIQKKAYNLGNLGYRIKNQRKEIENRLKEIAALKEALRACQDWLIGMVGAMNNECAEHNKSLPVGNFEYAMNELIKKIDELKVFKEQE